jgi:cytochrome P450
MKTYGSENTSGSKIDAEFLDVTVENLKIFLFAGHDTTASTLCFAYHYLHQHPDVLEKLRQEHDRVLGPDTMDTTRKISDSDIAKSIDVYYSNHQRDSATRTTNR